MWSSLEAANHFISFRIKRFLHTAGVASSILASPTIEFPEKATLPGGFFVVAATHRALPAHLRRTMRGLATIPV